MAVLGEELRANVPYPLGSLLFRRLGATTYGNLFAAGILNRTSGFSDKHLRKKPDAVIYNSAGELFAVIEEKADLSTTKKISDAIERNLDSARGLTKLLIITDNVDKTIYINTRAETDDRFVSSSGGQPLPVLDLKKLQEMPNGSSEQVSKLQGIVKNAAVSLSAENNVLSAPAALDPTGLAKTMWQKIYVNTGRKPEVCLYNVVELFIFKLLSDLNVLKHPEDFTTVFDLSRCKDDNALRQYAAISRPGIKRLFPASPDDGTTLMNGTIFVNEVGEANISHAPLFNDLVQQMQRYGEENGSFQHIHAEFKTRLFESFLRQDAAVKNLGQFFTPRSVVQAIVRMSKVGSLSQGQSLLDPFCGVGGFVLEAIAESENIRREFVPVGGEIAPKITVEGWDRGSEEKEEQRTIILAKANMLIYLSDIIAEHHSKAALKSFAEQGLGRTFKLLKEAGGTFSRQPQERYDVILTNPPYVRSGSKGLKEQLKEFRPQWRGQGTEALAMEWIVRALKPGGQAFVVVPGGLLRQHRFMLEVARAVRFDVVAKLPPNTFYATPMVTYIVGITKKYVADSSEPAQEEPVLGFIVREIGETRDAQRWETVSDLPILESTFRLLSAKTSAADVTALSRGLGKLLSLSDITGQESFDVDRTFWTREEKQRLGVDDEEKFATSGDFIKGLEELRGLVDDFLDGRPSANADENGSKRSYREISLGDKRYFAGFRTGRSVNFETLHHCSGSIPVFSASRKEEPSGHISGTFAREHDVPVFKDCIKWNINGSVGNPTYVKNPFSATSDVGIFRVEDPSVNPDFVALQLSRRFHGFDWSNKAGIGKLKKISIRIPLGGDDNFDRTAQDSAVRDVRMRKEAQRLLGQKIDDLLSIRVGVPVGFSATKEIRLEDENYFRQISVRLGSAWNFKRFRDIESRESSAVPVYTAAKEARWCVGRSSLPADKIIRATASSAIFSFAADGDGSAGRNFVNHHEDFAVQANRVVVRVVAPEIVVPYIMAQLATMRERYGFNRAFKAKWDNVKKIPIVVPVTSDNEVDDRAQRRWVTEHHKLRQMHESLLQWQGKHNGGFSSAF